MTSKKAPREASPDERQSNRHRGKTVRRSLVEASEAQDAALLARELRTSQTQQELDGLPLEIVVQSLVRLVLQALAYGLRCAMLDQGLQLAGKLSNAGGGAFVSLAQGEYFLELVDIPLMPNGKIQKLAESIYLVVPAGIVVNAAGLRDSMMADGTFDFMGNRP